MPFSIVHSLPGLPALAKLRKEYFKERDTEQRDAQFTEQVAVNLEQQPADTVITYQFKEMARVARIVCQPADDLVGQRALGGTSCCNQSAQIPNHEPQDPASQFWKANIIVTDPEKADGISGMLINLHMAKMVVADGEK